MKVQAIIFDFDGVICESVGVKKEAFRKLFENYPNQVDRIVQYHMDNGGISRFKKFDVIYRDMLKEPLSEEKKQELGRKFSEYCYQGVLDAPFVPGAYEFLEKYHQQLKFFVVSGTPEDEMIQVVKDRGLSPFFRGVYGSPRSKAELNQMVMDKFAIPSDEVIFVGDSINDLEGAQEAGISFIGRVHASYPNPFPDLPGSCLIKDLIELDKMLESSNIHIL